MKPRNILPIIVICLSSTVVLWLSGLVCSAGPCDNSPCELPDCTPCGNGDTNGDGQIDISDPIQLLSYLFAGGNPPVAYGCHVPPAECDYLNQILPQLEFGSNVAGTFVQETEPGNGGTVHMTFVTFTACGQSIGVDDTHYGWGLGDPWATSMAYHGVWKETGEHQITRISLGMTFLEDGTPHTIVRTTAVITFNADFSQGTFSAIDFAFYPHGTHPLRDPPDDTMHLQCVGTLTRLN